MRGPQQGEGPQLGAGGEQGDSRGHRCVGLEGWATFLGVAKGEWGGHHACEMFKQAARRGWQHPVRRIGMKA